MTDVVYGTFPSGLHGKIGIAHTGVSDIGAIAFTFGDTPSTDSFGRLRVGNPQTLFNSKQLYDNQPFLWDDAEVSGSGTSSTFSSNRASSTLGVSSNTIGRRLRQTYQRFNYQPGKSFFIFLTGILNRSGGGSGITGRLGYYDDNDGLFFQQKDSIYSVVRRSNSSGSPVDTVIPQSEWNLDTLDGLGPSGFNLDFSKTQIFCIDFEWLGVGRVRFGFVVNGLVIYCHEINNANILNVVYMSTPNLPLRYELINDGSGGSSTLEHICTSVIVEGGSDNIGLLKAVSTGGVHLDANTADTLYALIGLRLKTGQFPSIEIVKTVILTETNDNLEWQLLLNPTIASTFTYNDIVNSGAQVAKGVTANTVTGGVLLDSGWVSQQSRASSAEQSLQRLGVAIDGTRDQIVLCVRPLSANSDIQGSITFRENL